MASRAALPLLARHDPGQRLAAIVVALAAHAGALVFLLLQPAEEIELPVDPISVELSAPLRRAVPLPALPQIEPVRETVAPLPMPAPLPPRPVAMTHAAHSNAPPSPAPAPAAVRRAEAASSERDAWVAALAARIERYKRYPRAAELRGLQGTVTVRLRLDRSGTVLSAQLEHGTGAAMLDEEALAVLARAQPLPAPPEALGAGPFDLLLPIRFGLR
jgi:periplasmic protein TonB